MNILSLGCGPSPDLMAFEQINNSNKNISYLGYDINACWASIHSEIKQYLKPQNNIQCNYEPKDAFDIFENTTTVFTNINVIVMSYFLSSIPDLERAKKVPLLFNLIIEKILLHSKRII